MIRYFESSDTAAVAAKIHQPFMLHQSPCSVPGTRRMKATPFPVSSALAGQRITCWRRNAIPISSTAQVSSETRICAIESRKSNATCPSTCNEMITAARCSRGSRMLGSRTGYVVPRIRSVGLPEPGALIDAHGMPSRREFPSSGIGLEDRAARLYACPTMIEFHLDPRSGVAPYLQIVQQVKEALRLGLLDVGDQLPTVREVVADLAINPNTVAKAYRELEATGLVEARPGRGTFITGTLVAPSQKHHEALRRELETWLQAAERAGLDEESIRAVISTTLREAFVRRVA